MGGGGVDAMFSIGGGGRGYTATGEGGSGVAKEIPPWYFCCFCCRGYR